MLGALLPLLAGCDARTGSDAQAAAQPPAPAYQIGPGDVLSVWVFHEPDLGVTDVPVRPDGRISVPLIPDIQAAGKSPTQLASDISTKLKEYVRDPTVSVIVRTFIGPYDQQIRVIGEAVQPVAIPYRDRMTLLDVMIATKGLTRFAAGNRAVIVRRGADGQQHSIPARLDDLLDDGDIADNVAMAPGDTLIIPQSWF
ncbi:XrtA/PEP-CTERM system exopolysaccharide export protein [Acidisphaera rubrifaciens]|uniref:XrtA/PEP-CTERM system exopolysaccharide export protein n=1 Tax=Acidisphaera rubrifaciens TaxID=50715 RepID=UPI0006625019|nr:XrtA/PEP-CTERM system exopolysaccharide export protein [Acidisphaera rubrifaciens]